MHVFYTPDIQESPFYTLNEEESRHCSKVLRLGLGDQVSLVDGRGGLYQAEISELGKRHVQLSILEHTRNYQKRNYRVHIAIAPTKNIDRLEWFLEKATEIGIDEITPIISSHSERKIIKADRLEKVITSAVKQSLQAYHPVLHPSIGFVEFLKQDLPAIKMIAHCIDDQQRVFMSDVVQPAAEYLVLIGPEGDFSPEEIQMAIEAGFIPLTLGNTRLRTETAGLAACFELNYLNRS
jgi:16S rRNA (uracil1498-N3)-methyltransferase